MTLSLPKGSRGLRSRAKKAPQDTLPYAVGSRAAAPSEPAFGLLGRNAAERAQKSAGFSLGSLVSLCFWFWIFRAPQLPIKELRSCLISLYPRPPQQEIVNLVGKNDLLDVNILPPQALYQISGLGERNVAVVVAVHEEHRRLPHRADHFSRR